MSVNEALVLYSGVFLLGTFISAISQVLLKAEALKPHASRIKEYLNFPVILAYTLLLLTTFMCIFAYRVIPLSFGPVLESTSYVYITIFGALIFKEKVTPKKVAALCLILGGIVVYSLGL